MNDKTYDGVIQKVHELPVCCVVDVAFSSWIRAIQNTRIVPRGVEGSEDRKEK